MERSVLNDTIRTARSVWMRHCRQSIIWTAAASSSVFFDEGRVDDHMDLAGRVEHHPSMFLYGHDVRRIRHTLPVRLRVMAKIV